MEVTPGAVSERVLSTAGPRHFSLGNSNSEGHTLIGVLSTPLFLGLQLFPFLASNSTQFVRPHSVHTLAGIFFSPNVSGRSDSPGNDPSGSQIHSFFRISFFLVL